MILRVFLLSFALTTNVFAWGDIGHRIVGEIAEKSMNLSSKQKIKKFFGKESLASASTWPDEIKSDFDIRLEVGKRWGHDHEYTDNAQIAEIINTWHYTSIPDNMKYAESPKVKTGDIVSAMKIMEKVLRSNKSTNQEKREALRFLVHFVGDIHQPLHVGNDKDRGGNDCWVSWFSSSNVPPINQATKSNPEYVRLHALWDSKIIDSMEMSYSEYANKLLVPSPAVLSEGDGKMEKMYSNYSGKELLKLHKTKVNLWIKKSYEDWANESKELRKTAYLDLIKSSDDSNAKFCTYNADEKLNMGDIPNVSYNHRYFVGKIINLRLLQAGKRLAALLDSIF